MDRFVLAIDQGTTGSRALIVNSSGHIVADAYSEFPQLYPQPGWVEHDPEAIWQTTLGVVRRALAAAQLAPERIGGDRDHQPAGDHGRLGPPHAGAGPQRDRVAVPPVGRDLRPAQGRAGTSPSSAAAPACSWTRISRAPS